MEKILETLVSGGEQPTNSSLEERTVNNFDNSNRQGPSQPATVNPKIDTILTDDKDNPSVEEEMDDVMNVLKDLNDVATGTFASTSNNGAAKQSVDNPVVPHNVVESLTSVQDVAKVVDFSKTCINDNSSGTPISTSQAADEQCSKLNARQIELEKRFASISNRVNEMRCRMFGSHVADEITKLKSLYERSTQPAIQGRQTLNPNSLSASEQLRVTTTHLSKFPSHTIISRPGGIQLPFLPNTVHVSGRPLQHDNITLPNAPLQMKSNSSTSQTICGGITIPSVKQLKNTPPLPTTPLAPTDIDVGNSSFSTQASTKSSVSGTTSSPLASDISNHTENSQIAPAKKLKVDKSKKLKVGKEKVTDGNKIQGISVSLNKPELVSAEENEEMGDGLNHLQANLKHLVYSYDSEATESSSGGESCDEFDNYPDTSYQQNQRDRESKLYQRLKSYQSSHIGMQSQAKSKSSNYANQAPPLIKHRAKWTWLSNRAQIGSKWTWLTAQISDLEYRIRQQNDLVRQIRALKGPVTLGEQELLTMKTEPEQISQGLLDKSEQTHKLLNKSSRDITNLFDSSGRKIIIKEPIGPTNVEESTREMTKDEIIRSVASECTSNVVPKTDTGPSYSSTFRETHKISEETKPNHAAVGSCRTRPLKQLRRRCIIPTKGLFRSSARAAKESTVRCDCIHPLYSCAICFGRSNHTQAPDPVFQDRARTISLLDHSYHQVLSNSKSDVPLELLVMQRLKNRSWMQVATAGSKDQDNMTAGSENKRENMNEKERRKEERRLKKLAAKTAAIASGQAEDTKTKNRKKYAAAKKRKLERELEMELEEEGIIASEISPEELKAILDERRVKLESKKSKFSSNSNKRRNSEGSNKDGKKKRLRMLANNEKIRRKSVTVHHQADGNIHAMTDLSGNGDDFDEIEASSLNSSSLPSPSVHGIHQLPTMEQIRRKRETAFDIDNIVIPYSTMASARVEKLKYKEIQTPVWRIIDEEIDDKAILTQKQISIPGDDCNREIDLEKKDLCLEAKEVETTIEAKNDPIDETNDVKGGAPIQSESEVIETHSQDVSDSKQINTELEKQKDSQVLNISNPNINIIETVTGSNKTSYDSTLKQCDQDNQNTDGISVDNTDIEEDISDILYQNRHAKAEIEEQIRWRTPLWKSSGGQRAVHRSFSTASSTGGRENRDGQLTSVNFNIADQSKNINEIKSEKLPIGYRMTQRQDSRSSNTEKSKGYDAGGSLSSGCNTPDPLSPSMVEKVDTLEVNTRPSTPTDSSLQINADTTVAANIAASIKNRRRTSSATRSRDRNPSEDATVSASSTAAHSRCTTPIDQQPANALRMNFHAPSSGGNNWSSPFVGQVQPSSSHYYSLVEIRPFEPREFPLSEDTYRNMQKEDQKQEQQLSGFSSKVEVISETSLMGNAGNLSSATANDNNSSIFAALDGSGGISTEHHSQIRGTSNSVNNRYNIRGASGRFTSRSGGNSRSSSLDNTSQDGDECDDFEANISNPSENLSRPSSSRGKTGIKGNAVKNAGDINEMAEVTDDENDIDALLEENEDEDPDWSGEALQEDEDDDDDVEDIDDTDDPEWGPKKDENEVSTRLLLSSCPVIYWWVALLTTPYVPENSNKSIEVRWPEPPRNASLSVEERISIGILKEADRPPPWWSNLAIDERPRLDSFGKWIQNYFAFYALIGIIMFSNYLPWT